jgi:hypothetical protein
MAGNKKSFITNVVESKALSFILDSFDYAVTFLFRIKQHANMSFISSASLKSVSNVILKKIKITTIVRFIGKQIQSIKIKKIKMGFIFSEIGKLIYSLKIKKINLSFISSATQKTASSVTLKKIKIAFVGLYGTFYTLGVYDPQTLGTLDSQTLGALDFTVIP